MNKMRNLWEKTEKKNFKLFQDHFQDWWRFPDATVSPLRFAVLDENSDSDSDIQVPHVSTAHTPVTEEDVLAAQLEHGLDLLDREPENPAEPDQPHYQNLVALAVQAGLNVPPPPPEALLAVIIHQPPVALMAQQAAASTAVADSKLIGASVKHDLLYSTI